MTYEKEIKFILEGVEVGGSFITVTDGRYDTDMAEEEFFSVLRKFQKSIVQEAEEQEKEHIIDHLTPAQEEKLKEEHMKDYRGTDDDAPDAYEAWLEDITSTELKSILQDQDTTI